MVVQQQLDHGGVAAQACDVERRLSCGVLCPHVCAGRKQGCSGSRAPGLLSRDGEWSAPAAVARIHGSAKLQ